MNSDVWIHHGKTHSKHIWRWQGQVSHAHRLGPREQHQKAAEFISSANILNAVTTTGPPCNTPKKTPKESKTALHRDMCLSMFTTALFTRPMAMSYHQPRCPSADEWIWTIIYLLWRIQSCCFRKMGGIGIILLREISHTEENKYCLFSLVWNLKINK